MSVQVTIQGQVYDIPENSESPGWGSDLSSYLIALGTVANEVVGTGDISQTTFTIANNQTSSADVTGLFFDTSLVRGAIIEYSIYRTTNSNELAECGFMMAVYKSTAMTWDIARYSAGDAGVTFTATGNQFSYTSTNVSGTGYSGTMKFRAKALLI